MIGSSAQNQGYLAFLSYSRADDKWFRDVAHCVHQTIADLASAARARDGIDRADVFWDRTELPPNGPLPDHLARAIEVSEFFVALVGRGYVQSRWCRFELEAFRERFPREAEALSRIFAIVLEGEALGQPDLPPGLGDESLQSRFYNADTGEPFEHFAVDVYGTLCPSPLLVRTLRGIVTRMVECLDER